MANIDIQMIVACELSAIATMPKIGNGDKNSVDKAAVDLFRDVLNQTEVDALIVNGEGDLEDAPALYKGEKLGLGGNRKVDIAIDPVEGTSLVAKGLPGAATTLAYSDRGSMMYFPEMYMEKLFVRNKYRNDVSLDKSPMENIAKMQEIAGKKNITIMTLDRQRHDDIMEAANKLGCELILLEGGDVMAAISVSLGEADAFYGTGGSPEGVLMAALAIGGGAYFECRLATIDKVGASNKVSKDEVAAQLEKELANMKEFNLDPNKIYTDKEIVNDPKARFFATGITAGLGTSAIKKVNRRYHVTTIMASYGTTRNIYSKYLLEELPERYKKLVDKNIK